MFIVIGFAFVALFLWAISASTARRRGALPAVLGYSGLFFVVVQVTWATILFTGVVRLEGIGRWFGASDLLPWYGYVGWGVPLLATFVFAIGLWRRKASSQDR
jgi:hypothetical protein